MNQEPFESRACVTRRRECPLDVGASRPFSSTTTYLGMVPRLRFVPGVPRDFGGAGPPT